MALKYIADGFECDANLLLNEFSLEESYEFQVFASVWRKKNFSFIYMGRETSKELGEFTSEVFSLTSQFLESDSRWFQIGSVFFLYALYRSQILIPPVPIRMELKKLEIMKRLLNEAIADKLYSLHYVLDYLFKNAIEVVAFPTLLGPGVRTFDKSKSEFEKKLLMSDFRCNLEELIENKELEGIRESSLKYEHLKLRPEKSTDGHRRYLMNILGKLAIEQKNIITSKNSVSLKTTKNVLCNYPFIDSDLDQIYDCDDMSGNESDFMNEHILDENEISENSPTLNNVRQLLECDEIGVQKPKIKKHKSIRRRIAKTPRIRKYYEENPNKSFVMPVPSAESLMSPDSEDELLAN